MKMPPPLTSSFRRAALRPWFFASVLLAAGTEKPPLQPIKRKAARSEGLQFGAGS
jgi:hypothetical protein